MVDIWPFHGTRPYNQDAKNLIAPSTDHLSIENIEIFRKNNYSSPHKRNSKTVFKRFTKIKKIVYIF